MLRVYKNGYSIVEPIEGDYNGTESYQEFKVIRYVNNSEVFEIHGYPIIVGDYEDDYLCLNGFYARYQGKVYDVRQSPVDKWIGITQKRENVYVINFGNLKFWYYPVGRLNKHSLI